MTGASKILTVSYGTFSCTLEGFDDPFNTMKAIAEYFRDLAAGDRYFGAEPPTPDAAMLHRIAEREIHRRVEAKIQDNGVILRAGEASEDPREESPQRPALLDAASPEAGTSSESVAARLQRIRARHAQSAAEATAITATSLSTMADFSDQADAYTEDQHAEDLQAPTSFDLDVEAEAETEASFGPIEIPDQIEELLDAAEADGSADLTTSAAPDAAFDTPEALVSLAVQPASGEDVVIEDIGQDIDYSSEEALLAALSADLPEEQPAQPDDVFDLDAAGEPLDMPEDVAEFETEFDEDALLSRLIEAAPEIEAEARKTPTETAAADTTVLDSLIEVEDDEYDEDEVENDEEPEMLSDRSDEIDLIAVIDQGGSAEVESQAEEPEAYEPEAEAAPPQPAQRARARVIRIRRTEVAVTTQVSEAASDEAQAPEAAAPEAVESAATGALSDEAEAALQAELAALEAELGGQDAEAEPEVEAPQIAPQVAEAPAADPRRQIELPAEDDSVNRLMAQANSEMGGEETKRRQSAIAHLKAAVAATQADRAISGPASSQTEQRIEPYRNDLDRVVRPRRPQAEGSTPRPVIDAETASRPTPLVLVSAQRIDPPRDAARTSVAPTPARIVMPVRPRRVSSLDDAPAEQAMTVVDAQPGAAVPTTSGVMQKADQAAYDADDILDPDEAENVFAEATSFEDFAEQLGARALPDLLEAAAVYCAEVLQRPEFSRPLVMRQISTLPNQNDTAREDYLRGFGTLLRQGRITKVKRGMFALTDRSPYLAEARKLAG